MISTLPGPTKNISVLLVDDHDLFRQGVRALLAQDPAIQVVGEARNAQEAMAQVHSLEPEVVVLDIKLGDSSGLEVARAVKATAPGCRVLVLSAYIDNQYVAASVKLGAAGYLAKTASPTELTEAIRHVAGGGLVFAPSVAAKVAGLLERNANMSIPARTLTPREVEVLQHVARGLRNSEIADSIGTAVKTVEAHLENILLKLEASTRAEAVFVGLRRGLLEKTVLGAGHDARRPPAA